MPAQHHIELTRPQAEWVDWALTGPIAEHDADSLVWDKDITPNQAMQFLADRKATFLHGTRFILQATLDGEFVSDLLNMLEDVAPDLTDGYGFEDANTRCPISAHAVTAKRKSAALNAADKIRKALGI